MARKKVKRSKTYKLKFEGIPVPPVPTKQDRPKLRYTGLTLGCLTGSGIVEVFRFITTGNFDLLAWVMGALIGMGLSILIMRFIFKYDF